MEKMQSKVQHIPVLEQSIEQVNKGMERITYMVEDTQRKLATVLIGNLEEKLPASSSVIE